MEAFGMRKLDTDVWYKVRTTVNVGEPVFRLGWAETLFYHVLNDAKRRFKFEMRELSFDEEWLTFYIKPVNGLELPKIMQWVKQTFSFRFNVRTGRGGHLWGRRYESVIVDGAPPVEAGEVDWGMVKAEAAKKIPVGKTYTLTWVSLRQPKLRLTVRISLRNPAKPASPPG
jgi:hypothetical protein